MNCRGVLVVYTYMFAVLDVQFVPALCSVFLASYVWPFELG
jgi:hypothetical protein